MLFRLLYFVQFQWVPGGPGADGLGAQRPVEAAPGLERARAMAEHPAMGSTINPWPVTLSSVQV